jgi:hypothetical protein
MRHALLDGDSQRFTFRQQMLLTNKFVQQNGAHSGRQRGIRMRIKRRDCIHGSKTDRQ